ncbi:unnamed protein product [Closterium sp. NIES-65]|nr:unnamed protein product [Closterium sp. NIES-65]
MRPSGYTKQVNESPDEDMMGSNTRVSLDSKFASAVGAYPCFPAPLPIPGTVPHWLLSRQQAAAVSLVQPSYPVYGMAQSGAGAHRGFIAVPKQETLAGGEDSEEDGEGENEPGTKPTKYTGVYVEADTGKYGVKIVAKDKEGKKITKRVGAYTTIEEASYCYAAAAHVLRPGKGTRNSVALTPADKAALRGVGKQALVSDSPDSRSNSNGAPRQANQNRGEDVEGGKQAHIVSNINASEEEDDKDVGDAMRTMFETNAYRENDAVDTHGEEVRVSAGVFRSLLKSQDESAQKVARLETLLLEALAKSDGGSRRRKAERQRDPGQGCMNPKRQRRGEAVADVEEDDDEEEDDDYEDMAQICTLIDRLPHSFACLALAADKSRRADLNKTLSEWKTRAAGRVRDIALPKLGFFHDQRDEASPWARDNARTLEQIRERIGLGAEESGKRCSGAFRQWCSTASCIGSRGWAASLTRPGGNGHVVNGLKVLVKGSVSQAIRHFNPEYDNEKEEWIWGRHGLRLSACGLENMKPNAGASGGDVAGNDVQSVSNGGV